MRLSADAADAAYRARAENGTLFKLAFETEPRVEVERWRFGLELAAGITLPTVVGHVEGDEAVVLDGPWLRAGLGVARRFGGP